MLDAKFKAVDNWRAEGISALRAFFTGRLRPNDYKIIYSIILSHLLLAGFGVVIGLKWKSSGAAMTFSLWHVMLLLLSL
jgi:hypothetical protein